MKLSKVSTFVCPHCHKNIMVATHIDDSEPSSNMGNDKIHGNIGIVQVSAGSVKNIVLFMDNELWLWLSKESFKRPVARDG